MGMNRNCPHCGTSNDAAKEMVPGTTPKPGDVSMCLYCGEFSLFDRDLSLVKIEDDSILDSLNLTAVQLAMNVRKRFIDMKNETVVERFRRLANSASYHYADDSSQEWGLAQKARSEAMDVYRNNPPYRPQMDEIGCKQLWSNQFMKMREAIERDERVGKSEKGERADEGSSGDIGG